MASGRQSLDGRPQGRRPFPLFEACTDIDGRRITDVDHIPVGHHHPARPPQGPETLSAGRDEKPTGHPLRVVQSVEMFDQTEPDGLAHICCVGGRQPMSTSDRPHETGKPIDEREPRRLFTCCRPTHELAWIQLVAHRPDARDAAKTRAGSGGQPPKGGTVKDAPKNDAPKRRASGEKSTTPEERLLRREDVAAYTSTPGKEYAYRPGELLVDARDIELVRDAIEKIGGDIPEVTSTLVAVKVPDNVDIPALVADLRAAGVEQTPRLSPVHVLMGVPKWCGWPGADAEPAGRLKAAAGKVGDPDQPGSGVKIVVIDTGLDERARSHPLLEGVEADDPDDIDPSSDMEPEDRYIDDQAGHATFIAGIIRQTAPGASVRIIKVLDTQGVTDERAVADAIKKAAELGADVVNLSLGGYTDGDRAPIAILEALDTLPRTTAVIAAAGNLASTRVTWPAAIKRVIAVGAVDAKGTPAPFTNSGWWVDTCADGVDVHGVYVRGEENPEVETDGSPDRFEGHAFWSGSSFSCARVSAATAVEMARNGGSGRDAVLRLVEDAQATVVPDLGVLLA